MTTLLVNVEIKVWEPKPNDELIGTLLYRDDEHNIYVLCKECSNIETLQIQTDKVENHHEYVAIETSKINLDAYWGLTVTLSYMDGKYTVKE